HNQHVLMNPPHQLKLVYKEHNLKSIHNYDLLLNELSKVEISI
ncbi:MAG: hypothetical protein RJA25_187, partial [Bacteroidota bacterium]